MAVTIGKSREQAAVMAPPTVEDEEPRTMAEMASMLIDMPLGQIADDPDNERVNVGEDLDELVASIRERGVLEPVRVYFTNTFNDADRPLYSLSSGHRRVAASRLAGLTSIPALVAPTPEQPVERHVDRLVSNLQRKDLSALEKARGMRLALEAEPELTQGGLAMLLGISQPAVANTLRLLQLPEPVQTLMEGHNVPAAAAVALLRINDPPIDYSGHKVSSVEEMQMQYAKLVVEEGYSVRGIEKVVDGYLRDQKSKRTYVEQQRKWRDLQVQRDAEREATEAGQSLSEKSAEEIVKEQRSKAFFEGRARTARVGVAHATLRRVTALDTKAGPSLNHLKLVALVLNSHEGYMSTDDKGMWKMRTREQLKAGIEQSNSKSEVLEILCELALSRLAVDPSGKAVWGFSDSPKFADGAWRINDAIKADLIEAGLMTPDGNKIIQGPKAGKAKK